MKTAIATYLTLSLLSSHAFATDNEINPDTARAYQGHILTFLWPQNQSKEQVDYKSILTSTTPIPLSEVEISDLQGTIPNNIEETESLTPSNLILSKKSSTHR